MKPTNAQLRQMAVALIQTIMHTPYRKKIGITHGKVLSGYNTLREVTASENPNLLPLLPPGLPIRCGSDGQQFAELDCDEICTFCQQIINLLS